MPASSFTSGSVVVPHGFVVDALGLAGVMARRIGVGLAC
jgi:hypothetical protein